MKLYSYVVDHDTGLAPNPYSGVCTLCQCKYRKPSHKQRNIVELAKKGDWVVGTGGVDKQKSSGHGTLIYAMRVDKKLPRIEYHESARYAGRGDNLADLSKGAECVLISRHFYYFGANAIKVPSESVIPHLEKRGPGFRSDFEERQIRKFVAWLATHTPGKHGEPCQKVTEAKRGKVCRSSC